MLRATGSVAQMGLLTGVAGAAAVVAGIFAGILADRLDRWNLMAACDVSRMVLYGLIPLAWAFHPEVWLLYVILPVCAAIGMVFQVGYVTVVPALSGPGRITEANGLLYGAASAAGIAGPLLAGVVSALLGPAGAIGVDAASFAVSAGGRARRTPRTVLAPPRKGRTPVRPRGRSRLAAPQRQPGRPPRAPPALRPPAGRGPAARTRPGPGGSCWPGRGSCGSTPRCGR